MVIAISFDESIKVLGDLGLNGTLARTYLALLGLGESTVREVANVSKVARPDSYRALIALYELGLVEKIVTVPTRFKPQSLIDAVSILVQRRTRENIDLYEKADKLIKSHLESKKNTIPYEDSQFVLIPAGEATEFKLRKLIDSSRETICFMVPRPVMLHWMSIVFDSLKKVLKRKVTVRVITEGTQDLLASKEIQDLGQFRNFQMGYVPFPLAVWFRIFDKKEILLSTSAILSQEAVPAVWSNNQSMVELVQNYFDAAWFSIIDPSGQAFKKDKRQFDFLFANMTNGFSYNKMIFGDDGNPIDYIILEINNAFEKMMGLKKSVLGKRVSEVWPAFQEHSAQLLDVFGKVAKTGRAARFESYNLQRDKWYEILAYSPERGCFATIIEDITKRKKNEKILSKKQQELDLIFDSSPTIIFYKDKDGRFIQVNNAFARALEVSKETLLRKTIFDLYSPEIAQAMTNDDLEVMELKRSKLGIVEPYESPTGLRWIRTDKIPSFDENGVVNGLIGFSEDITERKKTEETLKESEEKFRNLAEESPNMIFINIRGRIIYANKKCEDVMGYKKEELYLPNFDFLTLIAPDSLSEITSNFQNHLKGQEAEQVECGLMTKGGKQIVAILTTKLIKYHGETGILGIVTDITDRKILERKLVQDHKWLTQLQRTLASV